MLPKFTAVHQACRRHGVKARWYSSAMRLPLPPRVLPQQRTTRCYTKLPGIIRLAQRAAYATRDYARALCRARHAFCRSDDAFSRKLPSWRASRRHVTAPASQQREAAFHTSRVAVSNRRVEGDTGCVYYARSFIYKVSAVPRR